MSTRTRSRINVASTSEYFYVDYSVGGSDTTSGPYEVAYDYEVMIDEVTPNFKKKMKSGKTIINPLTYRRTTRSFNGVGQSAASAWNTSGVTTSAWTGSGPLTSAVITTDGYPPPIILNSGKDKARRDAILMAISGVDSTPLATGEDLLELGETIKFLKSPLQGILKELRKMSSKSPRRKVASLVDTPAATWLTYRFALAPLVRSVHDILSEVSAPTKKPADIRVSHGRSSYRDFQTKSHTYGSPYSRTMGYSLLNEGTYHATVRYRMKTVSYDWRWRYGLRNKDLPEAFWAVMPLSFMVDRIFDVSSMISAARVLADPSVSILGCSITNKDTLVSEFQLVSQSTNLPRQTYSGSGEVVNFTTFTMNRSAFKPRLGDIVPVFKPQGLVSDLTKIADLVALIRVFTKK